MIEPLWKPPPAQPAIDQRHIHLWRARLDIEPGELAPLLSTDESARSKRFLLEDARRRFTVTRATLRRILGSYLGVPPAGVRLAEEEGGKPHLDSRELQFNVSHSGDLALIAVAARRRVGVDLERRRSVAGAAAIARRWFTAEERQLVERSPERFLELWTRKEAQLKAIGGAVWDIGAADLSGEWTLLEIAPAHEFVSAVVIEGPSDFEIEAFDVTPERFPGEIRD